MRIKYPNVFECSRCKDLRCDDLGFRRVVGTSMRHFEFLFAARRFRVGKVSEKYSRIENSRKRACVCTLD